MRAASYAAGVAVVVGALTWGSPAVADQEPPAPKCTKLGVIGDSLTVGSAPVLAPRLTTIGIHDFAIDAERGRHIRANALKSGVRALRALRKTGYSPDCFVVALGTNDIGLSGDTLRYQTWVEEMLAEIGDMPVLWVNVARAKPVGRALAFHQVLVAMRVVHPKLVVGDWAAVAAPHPEWLGIDGIHLRQVGYVARAEWLAVEILARLFEVAPPNIVPDCRITTRLRQRISSDEVVCLEMRLEQLGWPMPGGPDRRFDLSTYRAVARFQRRHWLAPNGTVGPSTALALGLSPASLVPGS